jgi:hypothetical protein
MDEVKKYCRKPFEIEAVQVTLENMAAVAEWCGGSVITEETSKFVKVNVTKPLNDRLTRAFVGDWVTKASYGYKVYTNKAFGREFQELGSLPPGYGQPLDLADLNLPSAKIAMG